jgi:hypothetical protein
MHTQVLRINYNHLKPYFAENYLGYKQGLDRCMVAALSTIDLLVQPLNNLYFEDQALQACWETARQQPQHELVVQSLGIVHYRHHLEELHEQLEVFLRHKYSPKTPVVFVSTNLDATCHLSIQLRSF